MDEIYEFLNNAKTFYLATNDGTIPQVRPFGTINKYKNRLYIQTGKIKDVSKQIAKNPNIAISAVVGDKWLRLSCKAINDDDINAKISMLDKYPELRPIYDPYDSNTQVFYLEDVHATINSFTMPQIEFKF